MQHFFEIYACAYFFLVWTAAFSFQLCSICATNLQCNLQEVDSSRPRPGLYASVNVVVTIWPKLLCSFLGNLSTILVNFQHSTRVNIFAKQYVCRAHKLM